MLASVFTIEQLREETTLLVYSLVDYLYETVHILLQFDESKFVFTGNDKRTDTCCKASESDSSKFTEPTKLP